MMLVLNDLVCTHGLGSDGLSTNVLSYVGLSTTVLNYAWLSTTVLSSGGLIFCHDGLSANDVSPYGFQHLF